MVFFTNSSISEPRRNPSERVVFGGDVIFPKFGFFFFFSDVITSSRTVSILGQG